MLDKDLKCIQLTEDKDTDPKTIPTLLLSNIAKIAL